MAQNVSEQLVQTLLAAGVKRVFAITGDSLNPVNDAIRRDGQIEWIHVRHEESAAWAASMDAELNGIGCCMGSSGPGHVHLVNGLYDANRAGNPVLAIASTCASHKFGQDYFQETNPFKLFDDCSKFVYVANTAAQVPQMLHRALQTAVNERGVAVLGLPGDVSGAKAAPSLGAQQVFKPGTVYRPADPELDTLAELLNSHQDIALYCGHGCQGAVEKVEQLAGVLKAPIVSSFRGKIFFDRQDSEFMVGLNGLLGYSSGYEACSKAELLVLLGTDFPYAEFFPKDKKIIQLDVEPSRLGRRAQISHGFLGDVGDTLDALLPRLKQHEDDSFLKAMRDGYAKAEGHLADFAAKPGQRDRVQPEYVAAAIDRLADEDAIFTVDTGMTCVWAARFLKGGGGRYLTGSFNHGSMANALPMAIGAAASTEDRQVVALCGDGGLSMMLGELAVLMQYQWPVKLIVFNNRSLGMVQVEMQVAGLVDWQTSMVDPAFDKVAERMDIKGYEVREPADLESTLKEAFAHEGPALVNVYTNADALAMPPHIEAAQMSGYVQSLAKKLGLGRVREIEQLIRSNVGHIKEVL